MLPSCEEPLSCKIVLPSGSVSSFQGATYGGALGFFERDIPMNCPVSLSVLSSGSSSTQATIQGDASSTQFLQVFSNLNFELNMADLIINGFGDGSQQGGAIKIVGSGDVNFVHCLFSNNYAFASGALHIRNANGYIRIDGCEFTKNKAFLYGAMEVSTVGGQQERRFISVHNTKFYENLGQCGVVGAFGKVEVTYSSFSNNTLQDNGGQCDTAVLKVGNSILVSNSIFVGNRNINTDQTKKGGALNTDSDSTVIDCIFIDNSAHQGGAISVGGGGTVIRGCTFTGNTALDMGGAIYHRVGGLSIIGCTFTRNSAVHGGAVALEEGADSSIEQSIFSLNTAEVNGGAIEFGKEIRSTSIFNSRFSQNTALTGSGGALSFMNANSDISINGALPQAIRLLGDEVTGPSRIYSNEVSIDGAVGYYIVFDAGANRYKCICTVYYDLTLS
jgi:hypothetical protein